MGSQRSRGQRGGEELADSSRTSTSADKPSSAFEMRIFPFASQAVFDVAGEIAAELQEFGELSGEVAVGCSVSEEGGFQGPSISRNRKGRIERD